MNNTNTININNVGRPPLEEPSERDKQILDLLDSGISYGPIVKKYNITKSRVGQIWHRWRGVNKPIERKAEKVIKPEIMSAIEAYKTGMKVTEIFTNFKVTPPTFYKYLRIIGNNPTRSIRGDKTLDV